MHYCQLTLLNHIFKIILVSGILLLISSCATIQREPSKDIILSAHNTVRTRHHVSNLSWDYKLALYARLHANKCEFKHSSFGYGENIAMGYPSPDAAVMAWYHEKNLYSYNKPGFSHATGHFTQIVWKGSQQIGCAYVACNGKNGTHGNYLVCEYSPAGNVINAGYFNKNVLQE